MLKPDFHRPHRQPARGERHGVFRGQLIKLYIICYLVYRFFTEMIRPEARFAGGLTGYQWAVMLLIPLFAWLWVRDARAMRAMKLSS